MWSISASTCEWQGPCGLLLPRLSIRSEMAGPALLRRYGSTALSLPYARLRNSFRPELCSNGASNSPRRPLTRAASARQVRVPEPPRDSRCRPSHLACRILSTTNQRGSPAMSLPPTTPTTPKFSPDQPKRGARPARPEAAPTRSNLLRAHPLHPALRPPSQAIEG